MDRNRRRKGGRAIRFPGLLPAVVAAALLSAGAYAAVTLWAVTAPASVTVEPCPYETRLYADEACTIPLTALAFPVTENRYEGSATSGWATVVLRAEKKPSVIIYIHVATVNLPAGATVEGQRLKYLSGGWENFGAGVSEGFFAPDSPLVDGKPTCVLRFRLVFPQGFAAGVYGFQIRFTVTDTATL